MKNNILEQIEINDLSENMKYLAEECGMEVVRTLIGKASGMDFYVPKGIPSKTMKRIIQESYCGSTVGAKRMAKEFDISFQHFYRLLKTLNE